MPYLIASLTVNQETNEPLISAGVISAWSCLSPLPAERALYALSTDQTAYDAIVGDNGVNGSYFIAGLSAYPPIYETEVARITSTADTGVSTLRNAATISGIKIGIIEVGGYIDLNTAISLQSNRAIEGGFANAPVVLRMSATGMGNAVQVGTTNTTREHVALRNLTIMPGRGMGEGQKTKHNCLLFQNGFGHLDHVTAALSNNEALIYLNTAPGKAIVGYNRPNVYAVDCVFGQTLYETENSSNPEGLHPMNVNGQELGYGIFRRCLLINCEQRNPKIQEGATGLLIDCYVYGGVHMASVGSKTPDDISRLELAGVVIRQGKRTSNHATLTNDKAYQVNAYLDVSRYLRSGAIDNGNVLISGENIILADTPTIPPELDKAEIPSVILAKAGARLPNVPSVLQLLVYQAQNQLGDSRITSLSAFFAQDDNPLEIEVDERGYPVTP